MVALKGLWRDVLGHRHVPPRGALVLAQRHHIHVALPAARAAASRVERLQALALAGEALCRPLGQLTNPQDIHPLRIRSELP